ncbi:hypothetical protein MARA_03240 (plasmid) [Mycolicibacterium arabiense]|uniref:Uncharacterized protein n=1 Tax=Mycolicibacterium arabiense TaxID=1286181 RepID=A0A7I7RQS1_9MYCO|nr:hypothetical protein [Mycolicibacterium arabiense]MCV7372098.1 hypothetical protein [Mycolicibacterium arabiense]BBY46894.1 hypothetical protein MARA_03240 [Mycolicibacterium arabiense]
MPAVTKPFTLKPAEAQAANASAPALVAETAAQAPAGSASSTAAANCVARPMWAPLAETVAEDEVIRQGLNAGGGRRIASIYQRKTEYVMNMATIDQENRQALTLLPSGGTVAV